MKKIVSCLLALIFVSTLICPCLVLADDDSVIHIKDASDLVELSENCTLDTWSYGKTVILENDIDLEGTEYRSIPVFSGTFNGQNHTITNLKIDCSGSSLGLFRRIGRGGQIKNLNVSGSVTPDGIKENIGGITGYNSGSILSCTFSGTVSGESKVGGIVGYNDVNGIITDCSVSGSVTGKTKVGGIAGENAGNIFTSVNNSDVNTIPIEFSASSVIGSVLDAKSVSDVTEISDTVKDIGGAAGYSSGIIRGCTNNGTVGYIHIGYNIGGIAGRHSGSIKSCTNTGVVYGRRNTGGIAGEMEPYTAWVVSGDALDSLRDELDSLQSMTDNLLDDVSVQSAAISDNFNDSIEQLNAAEDSLDSLVSSTKDFINGNVDTLNEISVRVSDFISGTEKVTDELSLFFNDFEYAMEDIKAFSDDLKLSVDDGIKPAYDCMSDAAGILSDGLRDAEESLQKVFSGFEALERSIGDADAMYDAMQNLANAFSELSYSISAADRDITALVDSLYDDGTYYYDSFLSSMHSSLSELNDCLDSLSGAMYDIADAFAEALRSDDFSILQSALEYYAQEVKYTAESLYEVIYSFTYLTEGMQSMLEDLKYSVPYISDDLSSLGNDISDISAGIGDVMAETDIRELSAALDEFGLAMSDMASAFGNVSDSIDTLNEGKEYTDTALSYISSAFGKMSEAADSMTKAASSLNRASDAASDLIAEFAEKKPVEFIKLDDNFTSAQDDLFSSLKSLSDSVNVLVDTVSSDILINDLRLLSDQIFKTFGTLIDLADSVSDVSTDPEIYKDDISDDDEKYSSGVITGSVNRGRIESDYNAGGIVGNISIEVAIDLEDDLNLSGILTKSAKHLIYAVVSECECYSEIEVKNNNGGGIVGNMDYGYVKNSTYGGSVESTDGDYIGGIAGYSAGKISNCMARVNLSGKNYIGGIAGYGNTVNSSYAMIDIDKSSERVGAIVGDSDGEITENYYLDNTDYGGIDGISYAGQAEPITYEELLAKTDSAEMFSETTVKFVKDGDVIAEISVPFGGSVDELPSVENKDGMYWVWDSFDRDAVYSNLTVEGKYCSPLTTISTGEDVPMFLVEGEFYSEQKLTVTEWTPDINALGIEVGDSEYKAYKISVSDCDAVLTVRMKHGNSGKLYVIKDGAAEETSFTSDGSYIVFETDNNSSFIIVEGEASSHVAAVIISVSCAAAAAAACVIIIIVKKKKSRTK